MSGPRNLPPLRGAHVHFRVADIAKAICLESYEAMMSNNSVRLRWKEICLRKAQASAKHRGLNCPEEVPELALQAFWVARYWRSHVDPARAALATMLNSTMDEDAKRLIHEALVADNTLVRGRGVRHGRG